MIKRFFIVLALMLFSSSAFAGFDEGKKAYDSRDWLDAIRNLRPLAELGDDRAMMLLANMYAEGMGVMQDYKEAMSLYKRAAVDQNNAEAMLAVGAMYTSGLGVPRHYTTARAWYERSARLGNHTAAYMLSTILFQGYRSEVEDLKPDFYNSYKWFRIIEKQAKEPEMKKSAAQIADAIAEKKMTKEEAAKADQEAAAWKVAKPQDLGPVPQDPVIVIPNKEPAPAEPVKSEAPKTEAGPVSPDTPPAPAPVNPSPK